MREIELEMVKFLDEKLANNGLAQHAIKTKDGRLLFRLACEACVGIREKGGNNKGPMVELIQKTIGGAVQEAWCMAAMQTCIAYAETKLRIKSKFFASEHCLTSWRNTPKELRVIYFPLPGAIIIWQHGETESGHTGCVVEADAKTKTMFTVEGNTDSGISEGRVERDGGGFYANHRSTIKNGSMRVVGFLKPF